MRPFINIKVVVTGVFAAILTVFGALVGFENSNNNNKSSELSKEYTCTHLGPYYLYDRRTDECIDLLQSPESQIAFDLELRDSETKSPQV
jgi:hypothetical protein